jgi:indolepyruvate ferredoxin oxidoreductase, alpha subunit
MGPRQSGLRRCAEFDLRANEKTAYEEALGVSIAGRRALVAMKHVGLNVAADPFMNSALVAINGGLVVAWPTTPACTARRTSRTAACSPTSPASSASSRTIQQEAYDMTREAFDLSERFQCRSCCGWSRAWRTAARWSRSPAIRSPQNPLSKAPDRADWILLPGNARRQWREPARPAGRIHGFTEASPHNPLTLAGDELGVITTGIARNYFPRTPGPAGRRPSHLHIGAYPLPVEDPRARRPRRSRSWCSRTAIPYIERHAARVLPVPVVIRPRSGDLPPDGELTPDTVRAALGLPPIPPPHARRCDLPARRRSCAPGARTATRSTRSQEALAGDSSGGRRDLRHRLLHARRAAAATRPSSRACAWAPRSAWRRARRRRAAAGGRGHRRQHVPALGHHAADRRDRGRTPT